MTSAVQTTEINFLMGIMIASKYLAKRVTAPATTGEATEVPESCRHLPSMLDPCTKDP